MGAISGGTLRPQVRINFTEHLKLQKQAIFHKQVTKGVRPNRNRSKQAGQRDPVLQHINHESLSRKIKISNKIHLETLTNNAQTHSEGLLSPLKDNRKQAPIDEYPYTTIGFLQTQFQNKGFKGTAFLISSQWILTCAHNFYDRDSKKKADSATFTLGFKQQEVTIKENGKEIREVKDFGEKFQISGWRFPKEYVTLGEEEADYYDFALAKLKNFYNLENKYGYFGLDSLWALREGDKSKRLTVSGYPKSAKLHPDNCKKQMQQSGESSAVDYLSAKNPRQSLAFVDYHIYTSPGQSGAPIFYEGRDKEYYMVGVHTLGGDELNRGVVITPKVREIINGWIEEMKTIFDISGRNIGNKGIMDFKASFAEMTEKITELRLGNNLIGPEGIKKLMENKWSSLKVLSLENNNLKLEGAQYISSPFHGWNNLQSLNLNNTAIGDEGCAKVLSKRSWLKLKELQLKKCMISQMTILELLKNEWAKLQTLNLGVNMLTAKDMKTLFSSEETKASNNRFSNLKHLYLSKNQIGNNGVRILVAREFDLQTLSLTGVKIDIDGMNILSKKVWRSLKKLQLDWNKDISIEGIKYLTPQKYPQLMDLNIDWTTLGFRGAKELMSHDWKRLKNISLNHNYLGDEGLKELKSFSTLQAIVLEGNSITSQGIIQFARNKQWHNLLQLKLRSNRISKQAFVEVIKNLVNLNCIDINNNLLDAHEKRELKNEASKINPNLQVIVDMGEQTIESDIFYSKTQISKLLLPQPLLHELQAAMKVVGEIVVLIVPQGPIHDLEQLPLPGIVNLPNLGLELMKPHLYGVELRTVSGQIHDPHAPPVRELHGLLLIVDRAVVHDQPSLSELLPRIVQPLEQLMDEIQVLVLAIIAVDYAPVGEAVLADYRNQGKTLSLRYWAVNSYLFLGSRPSLLADHVQIETGLVEEVDLCLLLQELLVSSAVLVTLLELLCSVPLLRHASDSFLLEFADLKQSGDNGLGYFLPFPFLEALQVLDLIELNAELVQCQEGIFLYQPRNMLQSLKSQSLLRRSLEQILTDYPIVERVIFLPLSVQITDLAEMDIETVTYLLQRQWLLLFGIVVQWVDVVLYLLELAAD